TPPKGAFKTPPGYCTLALGPAGSAPVQLGDLTTHDLNRHWTRAAAMPEQVLALGKRSEHGCERLASSDDPPQHIGMDSFRCAAHRTDLDLLASQFASGIDDERPRPRSDIDHDAPLEVGFVMVLIHEVSSPCPYNPLNPQGLNLEPIANGRHSVRRSRHPHAVADSQSPAHAVWPPDDRLGHRRREG